MSYSAGQERDISNTRRVVARELAIDDGIRNWLRHFIDKGAAKVDSMLIEGGTSDQLESARPSFLEHLHHLKEVHGLQTVQVGDLWMFDRRQLNA